MVRTKADCGGTSGAYRKVVAARAPRKVLTSSSSNLNSSPTSRKAESKYAGGNPVCVRPTPSWQKGIGEFFGQSSKRSEKENQILDEEPGCSGIGQRRRKALPLPPCPTENEATSDDEKCEPVLASSC
ncbi:PCNA-associated factor [Eublepharis macularius]|uniref:PCNA-associated factor n=1 Tax=Eublepharis macularius TaxID=481883 RepID=A0AA97LLY4_EUBMA|nr:PCNA-associated factor [Eublepharis macularius]